MKLNGEDPRAISSLSSSASIGPGRKYEALAPEATPEEGISQSDTVSIDSAGSFENVDKKAGSRLPNRNLSRRCFLTDLENDGKMDVVLQDGTWGLYTKEISDEEDEFKNMGWDREIFPPELLNMKWELVGVGDLKGSRRKSDLLFQHRRTGEILIGFYNVDSNRMGLSKVILPESTESCGVGRARIVATCDVNNDKRTDILVQSDDGTVEAWLMNGTEVVDKTRLERNPEDGAEWRVVGAGHFHSRGRNDLVLQKEDGTTKIELYDGTHFLSEHYLYATGKTSRYDREICYPYPASFHYPIVSVGDADQNGKSDIISLAVEGESHSLRLSIMNGVKERYCIEAF